MRWLYYVIGILTGVALVVQLDRSRPAAAQSGEVGHCPADARCVPAATLRKRQQQHAQCKSDLDEAEGKLAECRLQVEGLAKRADRYMRKHATCRAELAQCEDAKAKWWRNPLASGGIGAGVGAGLATGLCLSR